MKLYTQADIERALKEVGIKHPRPHFSRYAEELPKPTYQKDNIKLFSTKAAVKAMIFIASHSRNKLPIDFKSLPALLEKDDEES